MYNEIKRYRQPATYWLLITLSTIIFVISCISSVRETSQKRFMIMVMEQEVEGVTIVNGQTVEVKLTPDALVKAKYQGLFDSEEQSEKGEPHFMVTIKSEKAFRDELVKLNPTFPITSEKRGLFGSKS